MERIAVTGGIACGKSVVGSFLAEEGVPVCDCDDVARRLMEPGGACFGAVVEAFGRAVMSSDGRIDRLRLAGIVFTDPVRLARLNAIVHPAVFDACRRWLDGVRGAAAAVIVPLLFEAGAEQGWDAVVCVSASPAVQRQRLQARGLAPADAQRRMAAQMPVREKMARADYVIMNDGTLEMLRAQTRRVLRSILEN